MKISSYKVDWFVGFVWPLQKPSPHLLEDYYFTTCQYFKVTNKDLFGIILLLSSQWKPSNNIGSGRFRDIVTEKQPKAGFLNFLNNLFQKLKFDSSRPVI